MRVRNGLLQLDGVLIAQILLEQGLAAVGAAGRHQYVAQILNMMPATEAFILEP
jgi:hypothetical protein